MSLYDANEDGKITIDEGSRFLELKAAYSKLDANRDGVILAKEVAAYVRSRQNSSAIIVAAMPKFFYGTQPLQGATVTLEPAAFLGTAYPTYSTVTNDEGAACFAGDDARYPGIYAGFYKILVSKKLPNGVETIPAQYNSDTILYRDFSKESWLYNVTGIYLSPEEREASF